MSDHIDFNNFSKIELTYMYQNILKVFEELVTIIPNDLGEGAPSVPFITKSFVCSDKVHQIMLAEDDHTYFNALMHIHELLNIQRGYIFNTYNNKEIDNNNYTSKNILYDDTDITITKIDSMNYDNSLPKPDVEFNNASNINKNVSQQGNEMDKKELQRMHILQNTRTTPKVKSFNELAGLFKEKQILKEVVIFPIKYPHLFKGGRKQFNQVLLFGPPGTGKTNIAHALASELKVPLYNISCADLLSSLVGETEKMIRDLFRISLREDSSIIFIDEIDSLCRKRESREDDHIRRMKTELLTQMELINGSRTFLLCATNCPWDLDSAFLRRFYKCIYIPLPDRHLRSQILELKMEENKMIVSAQEWNNILDMTDGFSSSDISNLVTSVLIEPLKDLETSSNWLFNDGKYKPCPHNYPNSVRCHLQELPSELVTVRDVNYIDFIHVLKDTMKTVSSKDVRKFEQFINN